MKLCAKLSSNLSRTKHKVGEIQEDGTVVAEDLPIATQVEIVDEGNGVCLYRYDANGNCVGDTWHLTVDEAKGQAQFEYNINDDDWIEA